MESLEDVDLPKALNIATTARFVDLVERELAGLILATRENAEASPAERKRPRACRATFPPLKPRYATLLQVCAARLGLKATVHGWGDARYTLVEAHPGAKLPALRCSDFRPAAELAPRLADVAKPSAPRASSALAVDAPDAENSPPAARGDAAAESAFSPPSRLDGDRKAGKRRGMRGWSDDEDRGGSEGSDDWIAKRRRASAAAGRSVRGRGFAAADESADAAASAATNGGAAGASKASGSLDQDDEDAVDCLLQMDYGRYEIDPEDTWRPQRKPYAEMGAGWEFSGAWSFDPDEQEQFEAADGKGESSSSKLDGPRGVAVWRVEHEKGGDFTVALCEGHPGEARRWLESRGGRGEEPFVLEFRLVAASKRWDFRFGRASARQAWKPLPWSNVHRSSFWVASIPGADGKQQLAAGLDEFPERRFFSARVRLKPRVLGFGPPAEDATTSAKSFYVRDVAIFGRRAVLPSPWASRDHFVELPGKGVAEAEAAISKASLANSAVAIALRSSESGGSSGSAGGSAPVTLVVCQSSSDAATLLGALPEALPIGGGLEATWPPEGLQEGGGPEAAQSRRETAREAWAKLDVDTTRELAIFEEHTQRRTRHLEGIRIARTSATRMILGNLRGAAPVPKPPDVGV
eukprot:TRINITY_DN14093_c0_g1_i2.p1 TRINITY_DN14093_c0_g1~~TRINITY_DN14093_c0_g1_i2.p1  ORF type:complete len:667 (-),score=152.77 TRINITY_DN14093_c0_g1_i2:49-1962(-)